MIHKKNEDMESYPLGSLVDLGSLQVMADSHYKTTGMPIGIIDAFDDSVLVGAGWQDICLKFHRADARTLVRCNESDRTIREHLHEREPFEYKCKNGMWDIGMPIIVAGQHLASLFLGQFFYDDEIPDREFFRSQAEAFGFDESEYLTSLDRVPVFTRQDVHSILEYDLALIDFISDLAEKSMMQKEERKARLSLEQQLQQAQKMDSIGRLAGGIAHDYNNMLGVILGYSEILLEELDENLSIYTAASQIHEAGLRSMELNNKILAFARKQTISPRVINLNEAVDAVLKMLKRLIGEEIELSWNPGENLWAILMDPSQIDQILTNLCINARDAIDGVGKISIETGNTVFHESYCQNHPGFIPGEYIRLTVSDNGCGMSREVQSNLFEPFFTTKEMGKGTGLGLSMVYGAVRQNGGFINVYSEEGMGTTFSLYFVRDRSAAMEDPEEEKEHHVTSGAERILLVEDDEMLLKLTTIMLENMGYQVIGAGSPEAALERAEELAGTVDLMFSDVVMPGMSGRDLAESLKARYPDLKILFMSGYTADIISNNGVLDEGVDFIQKPYSNADLGKKIREVLDRD